MDTPGQRAAGTSNASAPAPDSEQAVFWRNRATGLFDRIPLPAAFCDARGTVLSANHAMASEWGTLPGRLVGRSALDLFRPTAGRLDPISEALRLRRRSRYPIEVSWCPPTGVERHGEMTIDLVGTAPDAPPNLLLILRIPEAPAPALPTGRTKESGQTSAMEARILALAAAGCTSTRIATEVGLTADGVNYHLARLSRRWGVTNRTALVARAYVKGVLSPHAWPPAPAAAEPPVVEGGFA
ncbi:LuxR C-terminal-related transcriptional regulator [Streptomyces sp. NPDC046931]|uniref:helix-turn-helix transcriptional regulator n=1 Tax=Streptomyces sp. NPDC046931 TaxID=3154806 RepID=UPI0033EE178C